MCWWFLLLCIFGFAFSRPFDDWKNLIFYAGAGLVIVWQLRRWMTWSPHWEILIIGCYLCVAALSLTAPHAPSMEGMLALGRMLLWAGLVWALSCASRPTLTRLAQWSATTTALIAASYVLQGMTVPLWTDYGLMFLAPIGHITYFSDIMALQIPLGCWFAVHSRGLTRAGWIAAVTLLFYGCWLTAGRASFAGLIAAAVVVLGLLWWIRCLRWRAIGALTGAAVLCIAILSIVQPASRRGPLIGARIGADLQRIWHSEAGVFPALLDDRWNSFRAAWLMIQDRPWLGHGIGSFRFVYPEYGNRAPGTVSATNSQTWFMHPHNEIMHQATEVGGLGLGAALIGIGVFVSRIMRRLRCSTNPEDRTLMIAAVASLTVIAVSWQFSTSFLHPIVRWLVALYGALLWRCSYASVSANSWSVSVWLRRSVQSFGVLLTLFLLAHHMSLYAVRRTQLAGMLPERLIWAHAAETLSPGSFEARTAYGMTLLSMDDVPKGAAILDQLVEEFPFVPNLLAATAQLRTTQGRNEEARVLLEHALRNDPSFTAAQLMLEQLPARE